MFESLAGLDGPASHERANRMRRQLDAWRLALPATPFRELEALNREPVGLDGALLYELVCEYHHQANYLANLLSENQIRIVLHKGIVLT